MATGLKQLTNVIGDRGENIFELLITNYSGRSAPLFRPCFLGEKWPTVDYYVELLGGTGVSRYFFVQVKSTVDKSSLTSACLKIKVPLAKCMALHQIPGPTYIVGIHEPSGRGFISSLHSQPSKGISHISINNELTPTNLDMLHNEVSNFWSNLEYKPTTSNFL